MTETQKNIPVGIEDYRKLVTGNYYYVDKTMFIKEILETGSQVMLFTRPRRFGKTLNLSMLDYFFNIDGSGKGLFDDCLLARSNNPHSDEQGKYPVISISLKEMKQLHLEDALQKFTAAIRTAFKPFKYLLESDKISASDKKLIRKIDDRKATPQECAESLLELTQMLYDHHGKDTVLLIDEYDVPLNSGYINDYYDEILNLIRTMLSSSCKTNPHLRMAVHTGCLRIAGESIYTGFNNPYINTILDEDFNSYFGFTPDEVETMLKYFGLGNQMPAVKEWYDGYLFGSQEIYNPWSILNYVKKGLKNPKDAISPYWANTSGNDLLLKFFECSLDGMSSRNDIERLLEGEPVTHAINENINFNRLQMDRDSVRNILFFAGYLKPYKKAIKINGRYDFPLALVNQEIHLIIKDNLEYWYKSLPSTGRTVFLVKALENGNAKAVEVELNDFLMRTVSFRDRAENFYHGYIAGLLSNPAEYECLSNREAGNGISDILLKRLDRKAGTVIEVKIAKSPRNLAKMAETALKQAIQKGYANELTDRLFEKVHVYGIACFGKKCCVRMQEAPLQ